MRIILASQSPRRRELLVQMGIPKFDILPAQGEEVADRTLPPHLLVEELALHKAEEIAAQVGAEDLVIAADTVVAIDGQVLGKPHSEDHAIEMLTALAGREHHVYTGFTVCYRGQILFGHEDTADAEAIDILASAILSRFSAQIVESTALYHSIQVLF